MLQLDTKTTHNVVKTVFLLLGDTNLLLGSKEGVFKRPKSRNVNLKKKKIVSIDFAGNKAYKWGAIFLFVLVSLTISGRRWSSCCCCVVFL